ncbi:hypothetical protein M569_17599 [Genlisea aurea]|uniref:Uncharacterized protein n=1 Tax=Genlisea aurea TaxID=192259 RepID=S8BYG6_9LAMI|nr:hypothetical protein M569_17599 [Genlisea aurea]
MCIHVRCSLQQELAAIFKKIGDKQTCSIGLYELYRITQLYPQVDIFAQLQNASDSFRTYIRDGLAQMEKNAAAGRTPSSVPLSTPPPPALNLLPKYGPLSPVSATDTKNRVDPTSFSLPPSYSENDQHHHHRPLQNPEDAQNDRFPSVSHGTLDAIRERMKSMQISSAAGGGGGGSEGRVMNGDEAGEQSGTGIIGMGMLPMDEKALSGLQARMERLKSGGSFDSL